MTNTFRRPGEFCWINMLTPEPLKALDFYTKVLGWEFFEMPGIGHGMKVGGRNIGGLFNTVSDRTPNGTAPMIGVMVKVDDCDAMAAKVKSLGGTAMEAFDVGPAGRMAVCHDPNGAQFDLWQPKNLQGTDVDGSLHGAPSWFETITSDTARAGKFYEALFGWSPTVTTAMGFPYTSYNLGGTPIAGMMPVDEEMKAAGMTPHWGVYFTVTDADAAAKVATEQGGTVCVPPTDIPDIGRFCGIISPQGVMFYAITHRR